MISCFKKLFLSAPIFHAKIRVIHITPLRRGRIQFSENAGLMRLNCFHKYPGKGLERYGGKSRSLPALQEGCKTLFCRQSCQQGRLNSH